jgi:DNA-binding CsgD family transcriptional regulator/tetratricopeptide (TPR) repeat protein
MSHVWGVHPGSLRFVGRRHELTELGNCVREAECGSPTVVLVYGPAGIGKTRLLAEFEEQTGLRSFRVRCSSTEVAPFTALRELLRQLRSRATARTEALPSLTMQELFVALLAELRAACEHAACILAIEDMHWAAPDVRAFADYVADALSLLEVRPRLVFLLTFREEAGDPAQADFIASLLRRPRHVLELPRLTTLEIADLARPYDLSEPAVRELIRLSEGVPLYVEELIPALRQGATARAPVPLGARISMRAQLGALNPKARQVIYAAAVLGATFRLDELASVCGLAEPAVIDSLQSASERRLIGHDAETGRYRFRHALVREVVYDELVPDNAARLHRSAARAIAQARDSHARLAEWAVHCERAGWSGRACILHYRAGDEAERIRDHQFAVSAFERARQNAPADDRLRAVLAGRHGDALYSIGDFAASAEVDGEAFRLTEALGRVEDAAQLARRRAIALGLAGDGRRAMRELNALAARLADTHPALGTSLIACCARFAQVGGGTYHSEYERWRTQLRRLGDTPRTMAGLVDEAMLDAIEKTLAGELRAGMRAFGRAMNIARRNNARELEFVCAVNAGKYRVLAADWRQAVALFRYADSIANNAWMQHITGTRLARLLILGGSLGEARLLLERCVAVPAYTSLMQLYVAGPALLLGVLEADDGLIERFFDPRYAEMALQIPSSLVCSEIGFSFCTALVARGLMSEARALVAEILKRIDEPWEARPFLAMVPLWGDARSVATAQRLLTAASHLPGADGYGALFRSHVLQRGGGRNASREGLRAAHDFNRRGIPLLEASAYESAGDRSHALAIYTRIGSVYDVARLGGARLGGDAFTIRQRQIVELVVNGYSNKAIAEALGIAIGTVGTHLAVIYRNRGVSSRAQLVAQIMRSAESLRRSGAWPAKAP